jgi:RimJ/RimL family protein N-acetyltransferase
MLFDFQPTLIGALVKLRALRPDDANDLFAVASDPLIWKQHPVPDRYKRDAFDAFFQESLASRGALAALDCKAGRIIGSSRFHDSMPTTHR